MKSNNIVTSRIIGNICPYCDTANDGVVSNDDLADKPEPGDISICFYCYEVSEFDEKLNLIKVDVATLPIEVARAADKSQRALAYFKSKGVEVNE